MEPLNDQELRAMLREWRTPDAPERMRAELFPPAAPWWRRVWRAEIRIPVPAAAGLILLLLAGFWLSADRAPQPPAQSADVVTFRELQPVKELKPRIIRKAIHE